MKFNSYFRLIRPHWTIASTLASSVALFAGLNDGFFSTYFSCLILLFFFVTHSMMEVNDELKDFKNYRKKIYDNDPKNPATLFSGGSGVLSNKDLTYKEVSNFFRVLLFIDIIIALIIILQTDLKFSLIILLGFFFIFTYNSFIKMSYNGLGEFANFISFGPILMLASYLAIKLHIENDFRISLEIVLISIIIGLYWFASTHISNMQDYDEDKAGNKNTLVVKYGKEYASKVPFLVSILNMFIMVALVNMDYLYLIVYPALILSSIESFFFMRKWKDKVFFLKKLRTFFVYRNFILVSISFIIYFSLKNFSIKHEEVIILTLLSILITLPATVFLYSNFKNNDRKNKTYSE